MYESKWYRTLEVFTNILLVNTLWLIACIPIITVYPATAAMFGVVRGWVRQKEQPVLRAFLNSFRENFLQSLWLGVVWTLLGLILALNFTVASQLPVLGRVLFYVVSVPLALLYILTSMFLLPVVVNLDTNWLGILRNVFLLTGARLGEAALCLLFVLCMALLTVSIPPTILVTGGATAYLVYTLYARAFERVVLMKQDDAFGDKR